MRSQGKLLQLTLDEEVSPDASRAERNKHTGHLVVTMPKALGDGQALAATAGAGEASGKGCVALATPRDAGDRDRVAAANGAHLKPLRGGVRGIVASKGGGETEDGIMMRARGGSDSESDDDDDDDDDDIPPLT